MRLSTFSALRRDLEQFGLAGKPVLPQNPRTSAPANVYEWTPDEYLLGCQCAMWVSWLTAGGRSSRIGIHTWKFVYLYQFF
jgi:hypothetical protein